MKKAILYAIIQLFILWGGKSFGQTTLFFNRVTVEQGLNDGAVQAIGRDKRGYMWISTIGGLNRYDGSSVKFFGRVYAGDSVVPISICRSIVTDRSGRLFFGFENGLAEYNYATERVKMVEAVGDVWVFNILAISDTVVLLNTNNGLLRYNPEKGKITGRVNQVGRQNGEKRLYDWCLLPKGVCLCLTDGIYNLDINSLTIQKMGLPAGMLPADVRTIAFDTQGFLWTVWNLQNRVVKWKPDFSEHKVYSNILPLDDLSLNGLYSNGNFPGIWIATSSNGLLQYRADEDRFIWHRHNPLQNWTISSNMVRAMYFDASGTIWVGGDYGVNYTNPNKGLFQIIPPFSTDITLRGRRVARLASEDPEGNLWFATLDGVVRYNPKNETYREWNNRTGMPDRIFFNSVRGILATPDEYVWVATGRGINRYNRLTGKMEFITQKDSVSEGFYFGVNADRVGNVWFCCRDGDGLYYWNRTDKKFRGISRHPKLSALLGAGFRQVYQDSKGRYWFGLNGQGLAMWDTTGSDIIRWTSVPGKQPAIAGTYLVDIKEDQSGNIWVSSFNGLTCIDGATLAVRNYTTSEGLLSNSVSSLGIDSLNRVWIGTARGLMMLDTGRKYFTSFGLADGLPALGFPEHAGTELRNGDFIMPTLNGFVRFNPARFQSDPGKVPVDITVLNLLNEPQNDGLINGKPLRLSYDQNALTCRLVGIHYENPAQVWYAYKLEGFEKSWHYTQDPKVVYTNLPGGHYRLRYKAGTSAVKWHEEAETLEIQVGTVFYKTTWFWILLIIGTGCILYFIYRQRMAQHRKVFELQTKTTALEREKALVMYENLKQHLNPHFLFNSLTSLSSLIRVDQQMAANFLDRMSKIYRYILKNRDHETVLLKDEVEFVEQFIAMQKTRFDEGLMVNIKIDEESLHRHLAPVTLQNLLENAIKHNTISKTSPLVVDIFVEGDYLVIRNNLQRKKFVETSNKQGLKSMQSLYTYMTPKPLLIEEDMTHFRVKVPLLH